MKASKTTNVIGCGGSSIKSLQDLKHPVLYIDTSASEEILLGKEDHLTVITTPHQGGSGGNSATNIGEIRTQVPSIVDGLDHTNTINVVVFSSAGGSGRAIAYMAMEELLKRGMSVVAFISVSGNDLNRAKNSSKTLIAINNLAMQYKVSLPIHMYQTDDGFAKPNSNMVKDISAFLGIFGEDIISLDFMDRKNALNPMGIDGYDKPGILVGTMITNAEWKGEPPVVCVTLALSGETDDIGSKATYIIAGILPEGFADGKGKEVHSVSVLYNRGMAAQMLNSLNVKIDELNRNSANLLRMDESSEFKVADSMDDTSDGTDGFVI